MKAKTIVSALIFSFAAIGAAQAANSEPDNAPFQAVYSPSASRSQIVDELQQAHAAGPRGNSDIDNTPFAAQADSGVTRAQAAAGVRAGYAIGDLNNQPFQGV